MRQESLEPPRPKESFLRCEWSPAQSRGSFSESPRTERRTISARARRRGLDHTIFIFLCVCRFAHVTRKGRGLKHARTGRQCVVDNVERVGCWDRAEPTG